MKQEPQYRSYAWVISVVISVCIGTLTYSFQMNSLADSLKSLLILYRVPADWKYIIQAVLTASANFGAFIGCLLSLVAIHFSYRRTIIVLDCLLISGSFLEMSENLYIFLAGRVIAGIGAGLHSVIVPLFIKMIAPKQMYGTMAAIMQAAFALGYMMTSVFGLFLETPENATYEDLNRFLIKSYFFLPSVFSIIRLIVMLTLIRFDPPFYYLTKSEDVKAVQLIEKIYKDDYQTEVLANYRTQLDRRKKKIALLSPTYRIRFLLAMFLNIMYQFNGLPAVLQYSTLIFLDTTNERIALILTLTVSVFKYFFYTLGSSLQQRLGRRAPYLWGNGVMTVAMFGMTVTSYMLEQNLLSHYKGLIQYLMLVFIFIFMFANFNSVGFLGQVYIPELVPDRGVSISYLGYWASSNFTLLCFPPIKGWAGMSWCFLFFSVNCCLAEYIMYRFGLETVNKNESEIDQMFEKLRARSDSNYVQVANMDSLLAEKYN